MHVSASRSISRELAEDLPRGERPLEGVLDVDDVETTNVLLAVGDDTATTPVTESLSCSMSKRTVSLTLIRGSG